MTEKNTDAGKKVNQPQDKFADERLTDEQLDKVAGGYSIEDFLKLSGRKTSLANGGKTSGK